MPGMVDSVGTVVEGQMSEARGSRGTSPGVGVPFAPEKPDSGGKGEARVRRGRQAEGAFLLLLRALGCLWPLRKEKAEAAEFLEGKVGTAQWARREGPTGTRSA